MIDEPNCSKRMCIHYQGVEQPDGTEESEVVVCDAFPDGIPHIIAYDSHKHLKPVKGDHGIQFKKA